MNFYTDDKHKLVPSGTKLTAQYEVFPVSDAPGKLGDCLARVGFEGEDTCGKAANWAVRITRTRERQDGTIYRTVAWSTQCDRHWGKKYAGLFVEVEA
jgi:hypothetical protein